MKRLLTILLIFAGIACSHSAMAQNSNTDKKKEAKKVDSTATQNSEKSSGAVKGNDEAPSGGGITIDESGAPKPKKNTQSTAAPAPTPDASAPKGEAKERSSSQKSAEVEELDEASPIAIDDSGSPKVKKGKTTTDTPANSDSIKVVPAAATPKFH